jgi:hypothetical protein
MFPQMVAPKSKTMVGRKNAEIGVKPTAERQARLSKNKAKISHRIGNVDPIRREEWRLQWRKGVQATVLQSRAPKHQSTSSNLCNRPPFP